MSERQIDEGSFSPDTLDFLRALRDHGVRYLIVGGEAVIYYGHARVTGDIDFFYESSEENVRRLFAALQQFWGGNVPGVTRAEEFLQPGLIVQFGVPPNRIDLVNRIDGVTFADAWPNRLAVTVLAAPGEIPVWFVGIGDLIVNKRAAARPKDMDDLRFLTQGGD